MAVASAHSRRGREVRGQARLVVHGDPKAESPIVATFRGGATSSAGRLIGGCSLKASSGVLHARAGGWSCRGPRSRITLMRSSIRAGLMTLWIAFVVTLV